jgi:divalent metal cation (Fe/Co/Zn/Cd) transporter
MATAARAGVLRRGLHLEYLTIGWNIVEAAVAIAAAVTAGSIALLGFGIDSLVETASGAILVWRLAAERRTEEQAAIERLDRRAHRLVGASLLLLAAYIAVEAGKALLTREQPRPSAVGMVVTAVSLVVMWWLARAKRRAAAALASRALAADSFQTSACFWLSLITLGGVGLNLTLGWWWADPVAALGMTFFLVREGLEGWRGEECCP